MALKKRVQGIDFVGGNIDSLWLNRSIQELMRVELSFSIDNIGNCEA